MQDGLASYAAAKEFAANLTAERENVLDFLFVIADDILTPQQEATCEVLSYPWHPDFLEMSHILAGRHGLSLVSICHKPHPVLIMVPVNSENFSSLCLGSSGMR